MIMKSWWDALAVLVAGLIVYVLMLNAFAAGFIYSTRWLWDLLEARSNWIMLPCSLALISLGLLLGSFSLGIAFMRDVFKGMHGLIKKGK